MREREVKIVFRYNSAEIGLSRSCAKFYFKCQVKKKAYINCSI